MSAGALKIGQTRRSRKRLPAARARTSCLLSVPPLRRGLPGRRESGVTPDRLIRLILLGDEAGRRSTTCWSGSASPATPAGRAVRTTSRPRGSPRSSSRSPRAPPRTALPKVAAFHGAFVKAAGQAGRFNELAGMGMYEPQAALGEFKRGGLKAASPRSPRRRSSAGDDEEERMHLEYETREEQGRDQGALPEGGR